MLKLIQLINNVTDGRFISPIRANKVLTNEARLATDSLIKFLGYKGIQGKDKAGNGTFDVFNSPAIRLLSGKIPSYQINTNIKLTVGQINEAVASAAIYADDTLGNKELCDTINIKNCNGTDGGLNKRQCAQNAGRRVIISTDYIINDNYFKPLTHAVKIKTVAACAPNLSNSGWNANNNQRDQFVTNNVLDETKYKNEMKSRAELMLNAMHAQGVTHPIIPAIGTGDFAGGFSEKCAKLTAQAFMEVIKMGRYPNFKGLVFSVTDGGKINLNKEFSNVFSRYQGFIPVIITKKEMTTIAIEIGKQIGNLPGYVIADHPTRRPGNGWAVNEDGTGASAQEETCTKHLSCYLLSQSHELNKNLLKNIRKTKLHFPSKMQTKTTLVKKSPEESEIDKILLGIENANIKLRALNNEVNNLEKLVKHVFPEVKPLLIQQQKERQKLHIEINTLNARLRKSIS